MNFLFAIGMLVVSYLLTPKPQAPETPKPNTLDDFDFPQVEEGTAEGVVFGDVWIPAWMVLWYGDMRTSKIKSEKGGKK